MAITSNPTIQSGAVSTGNGTHSFLNVTANTLVKATPGRICTISVVDAGTGTGTINDVATLGAAGVANQIFTIPEAVGTYVVDFPCGNGIALFPAPGSVLAVSFN